MSWIDTIANAVVGVVVSKVFSKNKAESEDVYNTGTISNNGSRSYDYNYSSHNIQSQGYNYSSQNTSQDYNYSSQNTQPQYYNYPPSPYHSNNYNNYSPHNTQPQNSYYPSSPYPSNNYNNYSQPQNYNYPPSPSPSSSSKRRPKEKKYSQNHHIEDYRTIDEEYEAPSRGFFGRKKKKGYEEKGRVTRSYADWNGDGVVEEREYHRRTYGVELPPSPAHWPHSQTDITRYN